MRNAMMIVWGFWMFLLSLTRPLMNEHGEVNLGGGDEPPADGLERDDNGFIKGTNFKTVADLHKGHLSLNDMSNKQANELGQLRGQAQTLAETLKETLNKEKAAAAPANGVDYDKEITSAQTELKKLDPMKDDFAERQAELVGKITDLKADRVKNAVLGEAGKLFQEELKSRDVKTAQRAFLDNNPTFDTPEMQARINDYLSKDKTGMHDRMSAFFALQAADESAERMRATTENEELKKVLNLQKGKDGTGKVIAKGQSPGTVTNPQRVTGEEADAGARAALAAVRG